MPRCSSFGCSCSYCVDCGKEHNTCICDLKSRTNKFLEEDHEYESGFHQAVRLLDEWARNAE